MRRQRRRLPSAVGALAGFTLAKQSLVWQILGTLLMISHVLLVRQTLYFYPVMIILAGWIYWRSPLGGLLIWFQVLLYQNLILSIFSPNLEYTAFNALQGTNFVMLAIMGLFAALRLWPSWRDYKAIVVVLSLAMVLAIGYFGLGAAKSGISSAMFYFRQVTGPLLAAIIGIDAGRVWGFRTIGRCLLYGAIPSIVLSVLEFCFPIDFYILFNEVRYYQLKYWLQTESNTFYVPQDIVKHFTAAFFNLTGSDPHDEWSTFRFGGTIINPVSNAYILAIIGLVAISVKQSKWLLLIVPLLGLIGVKGATVLLASSLLMWLVWLTVRNRRLLVLAGIMFAIVYVGGTLIVGLHNGDYHALGFMGGVRSLASNPIGHGLGVGGNASAQANAGMHWEGAGGFRSAGVDFALESAVGVLFYQMGMSSIIILGTFAVLLFRAPLGLSRTYILPVRSDILFFALGCIMLNGVFQEEAYAPYAAGLLMLLSGVLIGNHRRHSVLVSPTYQQRRNFARQWA